MNTFYILKPFSVCAKEKQTNHFKQRLVSIRIAQVEFSKSFYESCFRIYYAIKETYASFRYWFLVFAIRQHDISKTD